MPSCGDYIMHFLTLPWKLIFAFIPPTGKNGIQYTVHSDSRYTRIYSCNHNTSFSPKVASQDCVNANHINILGFVLYRFHKYAPYQYHIGRKQESQSRAERKCIPAPQDLATPLPLHVPTAAISSKTLVASSLESVLVLT